MNNQEKSLLEELLLGIRDVGTNCRIVRAESRKVRAHSQTSTERAQLEFVQRNLGNLAEDLDDIVHLAQERFELDDLEDRPSDTI